MKSKLLTAIAGILLVTYLAGAGFCAENNKLDLNKATAEQLAKVPGLNQELAKKMVQLREKNGEFVDLEELLDVEGIDNNLLRALKQHLFISDAAGCNC